MCRCARVLRSAARQQAIEGREAQHGRGDVIEEDEIIEDADDEDDEVDMGDDEFEAETLDDDDDEVLEADDDFEDWDEEDSLT